MKYQGIRPAPGYPSQPDHREKKTLPLGCEPFLILLGPSSIAVAASAHDGGGTFWRWTGTGRCGQRGPSRGLGTRWRHRTCRRLTDEKLSLTESYMMMSGSYTNSLAIRQAS